MPISWPYAFDALTDPTASDKTNSSSVPHAEQHANLNNIAEALELKVGLSDSSIVGSSAASTMPGDVLFVGDSSGRTRWGPRAMVCLADVLSTGVASVTFSAIPQNYRHLKIIGQIRTTSTAAQVIRGRLNGDTSTSYASQLIAGVAASVTGGLSTGDTSAALGAATPSTAPSLSFSPLDATIHDYTSTGKWKSVTVSGGFDNSTVATPKPAILNRVSVWTSTAALTSLTILNDVGDIASGSRLSLYGLPSTQ